MDREWRRDVSDRSHVELKVTVTAYYSVHPDYYIGIQGDPMSMAKADQDEFDHDITGAFEILAESATLDVKVEPA